MLVCMVCSHRFSICNYKPSVCNQWSYIYKGHQKQKTDLLRYAPIFYRRLLDPAKIKKQNTYFSSIKSSTTFSLAALILHYMENGNFLPLNQFAYGFSLWKQINLVAYAEKVQNKSVLWSKEKMAIQVKLVTKSQNTENDVQN